MNEMLVQMEAFEGVFVCATNLFESLDRASLRRFALKIAFSPLRREQCAAIFQATLVESGSGAAVEPDVLRELGRLEGLTPGDFATVVRRCALLDDAVDPQVLLRGLTEEWRTKSDLSGRPTGFRG